jgi:hypothetical protein
MMDEEMANEVVKFMKDELDIDANVMADYSGRGMYGSKVAAITLSGQDVAAIGYAMGRLEMEFSDVPSRVDNMGRDVVVY